MLKNQGKETAMKKAFRLSAVLLAAVILFIALLCAFGVDHDCTGEGCLICALITAVRHTTVAFVVFAGAAALQRLFSHVHRGAECRGEEPSSLVRARTKLSE